MINSQYLTKNNLLFRYQSGFRSLHASSASECLLFSKPSLYADDTSLYHANGDLKRIHD